MFNFKVVLEYNEFKNKLEVNVYFVYIGNNKDNEIVVFNFYFNIYDRWYLEVSRIFLDVFRV